MVWIPPIEWWWLGAGLWHWVYPIISHMSIYMQGCSKPLCLPRIPDTSAWSREVRAYVPRRKIKRVKPQVPRLDDWEMTGAPCCRRIEGSGIKSLYIFRGAEWTEHVAEYGLQPTYTYIYMKNQFSLFIFLVHKTEPENTVPTKQNSDLITNMILLNDFKWIIRVWRKKHVTSNFTAEQRKSTGSQRLLWGAAHELPQSMLSSQVFNVQQKKRKSVLCCYTLILYQLYISIYYI